MTVQRMEETHIVVGLLAAPDGAMPLLDKLPSWTDASCGTPAGVLLGAVRGSVGLDCMTGEVLYCGPAGAGSIDPPESLEVGTEAWEPSALVGAVISLRVHRKPGQDLEAVFTINVDGTTLCVRRSGGFGNFHPHELHPVVEFRRPPSMKPAPAPTAAKWAVGPRGLSQETLSSTADWAPSNCSTADIRRASRISGLRSTQSALSLAEPRSHRVSKFSENSPELLDASLDDPSCAAAVDLSYEPQLSSDNESIQELFNVLFNTIQHKYHDMHGNGVIGDTTLSWLTESVNNAMDIAQHEVNALTSKHFRRAQSSSPLGTSPRETSPSRNESKEEARSKRALYQSMTCAFETGSVLQRLRNNCQDKKLAGLFEPILVEHMCLEAKVSRAVAWDRLPRALERLRQYGYGGTRAKVEALWAFVVAHERVVKDSTILERFPVLVRCIKQVVAEVKADLNILEELQPRRFFYAKHLLAMRVLMNRRLGKLRHLIEEGWLTAADGEGLILALQERIVQVDHFLPHLQTSVRVRQRTRSPEPEATVRAWTNPDARFPGQAWQGVDFARRSSRRSSNSWTLSSSRSARHSIQSSQRSSMAILPNSTLSAPQAHNAPHTPQNSPTGAWASGGRMSGALVPPSEKSSSPSIPSIGPSGDAVMQTAVVVQAMSDTSGSPRSQTVTKVASETSNSKPAMMPPNQSPSRSSSRASSPAVVLWPPPQDGTPSPRLSGRSISGHSVVLVSSCDDTGAP
jgi:hypothetical protein